MSIIWDIDFRGDVTKVEDQSREGTCVSHAVTNYNEVLTKRAGRWEDLSRRFPYFYTKRYENNLDTDGCYVADMLRLGQTYGFCLESECPYVVGDKNEPSPQAFQSGRTRLITDYQVVPLSRVNVWASVAAINKALEAGFPVLFTMALYDGYYRVMGPLDTQNYSTMSGNYIGRHEQVIVGRSAVSGKWLVLNQWGLGWGDQGYAAIKMSESVNFVEAYIIYGFDDIQLQPVFAKGEVMPTTVKFEGRANEHGEVAFQHNVPNITSNLIGSDGHYVGQWGECLKMNLAFVDSTFVKFVGAAPNAFCIVSLTY